ncbi:MAG: 1-deoxy-D-xylulose-5-phosphate reductoisomerase [Micavibrio aeruginosavorus]|uniref:1-deoxy-D-xylulose 5-phosphate reductoisomerase n=1 Tax=Micavibrio aeruginosavorus TaxID=349221 RepID=A0A7T5R0N8_9BACT|nr:MAG: 1-deoxy-D-xylulose-5-phosphate reductoisomerase [Micavibrio aeruginosavorus]
MKTVSVLGSTGSVGRSTVDLILSSPENFAVQVLTAQKNAELLAEQARKTKARKAVIGDESLRPFLSELLAGTGIEVAAGRQAVIDAGAEPADWVMAAIVGMAGLEPLLAAINQGCAVAIANKEPLVAAGPLVIALAHEKGTTLLPVDSEHNAIFQVFEPDNRSAVERLVLTASGGPFRTWAKEQIARATPAQAVAHPNWSMGAKISIDSASMMNKALEVIEAHYLFSMPPEKIEVLVHPQSVIHSMVEYADGSFLAQLGAPDMKTPIAYALAWPRRMQTSGARLDIGRLRQLDFSAPDHEKFPLLPLAYGCLRGGQSACVAFNAANEVAVAAFLQEKIGFTDIYRVVSEALEQNQQGGALQSLEDILLLDHTVRRLCESYINSFTSLKRAGHS